MDKTFDPGAAEGRIYAAWEASGAFEPRLDGSPPFCIVIPPPNVTGSLHIGHALNNTLQDVLARHHRMRGFDVLWQPGMDHAGIATQMVVERRLAHTQQPSRRELGRDAFIEKVWEWKAESGGVILQQLKRLGASCAWSRERFTMDEGLSAAVRKVFVELYREGLIYRDTRLVNWDPKFQTAISDLEVENVETPGKMWHFAYPLEGEPVDGISEIVIATTRPETMLGDGAVAVHPDDERYKRLVGRQVLLPLADRLIPIIADAYPDPEKGSGAVKITGAHDFNDYEVARRHDLPMYVLMDEHAAMRDVDYVPEAYRGLDRYVAREKVVADIEAMGLLRGIEEKPIMQPFGDRSGVVIEPMLTDQWFADAATLAQPAIEAVREGRTRFTPESWSKTYFNWMENIQPWCVSRQLWWGHRIPAWYGPDGHVFVAHDADDALVDARERYGRDDVVIGADDDTDGQGSAGRGDGPVVLRQDPDVLDTWFSSALWPFSTLGWPEKTPELETFYPTSVLVTAFDIIFFWVARMMMQGLHFQDDAPFRDVYIHALVRDEDGQKMSKSKGNVLDPLDIIDGCGLEELVDKRVREMTEAGARTRIAEATKAQFPDGVERFGADALRFTLASMAAQGRDIRLSVDAIRASRNFGTKIWNAARLLDMNRCAPRAGWDPASATSVVNRWIVSEAGRAADAVSAALAAYRFNEAADAIYRFAWNVYCDWYLELIKPVLEGGEAELQEETRACASWAFDQLLALLHPFSPFITEELWAQTAGPEGRAGLLMVAPWPQARAELHDGEACADMEWLIGLVTDIRSVRAEMNIPPSVRLPIRVFGASAATRARLKRHEGDLQRLARAKDAKVGRKEPEGAVQIVVDEARVVLPLKGLVDLSAEAARLAKAIAKTDEEIGRLAKKLGNEKFVARAPEAVVAAERAKLSDYESQKAKLAAALERVRQAA